MPSSDPKRMAPDLWGCPQHGLEDFSVYPYRGGRVERRCQVCARAKYHAKPRPRGRYNGPRCVNGHLKTAFTWRKRPNRDYFYCLTCNREGARRAHAKRKEQAA